MRVMLTCTSIEASQRQPENDGHYPMGLAYLHACIKDEHDVKTLFLNDMTEAECLEILEQEIEKFKPDVVGISIIAHSRVSSYRLIEYLQEKKIKTILGGIHVTSMYEQIVNKYRNVIAVIGEGEETLKDLLKNLDNLSNVQGIAYFDGEVKVTPRRDLIADLDTLPLPEHDLFLYKGKTLANVLTSRGCPFKCNFCVLDTFSRRKVRFRSAKSVVDEIEYILEHPTVTDIWFHDDAFLLNEKRAVAICDELIKRGVKARFICSARFKPLSKKTVDRLEEAGFYKVMFGLESGAENVMRTMHKGVTRDDARRAIRLFKDSKVLVAVFLIIGLPGETDETILETGAFIQELQKIKYFHYNDISTAFVFPGSELYELSDIEDDYWLTDGEVPFYTKENSFEKLKSMKQMMMLMVAVKYINTREGRFFQEKMIPLINEYMA